MKKIPKGSEVCNIMVGEVEDLEKPVLAFLRLKEARLMEGLTEVKLPTRYGVLSVTSFLCEKFNIISLLVLSLNCLLVSFSKPLELIGPQLSDV